MGRGGEGTKGEKDVELPQDELLALRERVSALKLGDDTKACTKDEVLGEIKTKSRSGVYEIVCQELGWGVDEKLMAEMKATNATRVAELDAKIKDAEDNLGETEVREAMLAKAEYLLSVGDPTAKAAFEATIEKTVAVGHKIDIELSLIRAAFFGFDIEDAKVHIDKARKLIVEGGGDWERKNRLKVYEGLFFMMSRDFPKAAALLLDSTATFTSTELLSYETFTLYTVVTSLFTLGRVDLKEKVVDSPEIRAVIGKIPNLEELVNAYYGCRYNDFMVAFASICDQVRVDPYLNVHSRYFIREARVAVYSQFLASYKSVTMQSMADAFGVAPSFLDKELSGFIASGRLSCKIDKVAGVIETSRADVKTQAFNKVIKDGDALLNKVQKLTRVTLV